MVQNDPRQAQTVARLKTIMRRDLKLGPDLLIADDMPLLGGDADIDSLDVLLMLSSMEREFGFKVPADQIKQEAFTNLQTLGAFVLAHMGNTAGPDAVSVIQLPRRDPLGRLPHQPPFRFVSRVLNVIPRASAEGIWAVTGSEDFFKGHFPGRPIVPGVLITEAMAQLCGLAHQIGDEGRLAHIDVRIDSAVVPPAEVQLQCKVNAVIGRLVRYEASATVAGVVAARGVLTLHWSGSSPEAS